MRTALSPARLVSLWGPVVAYMAALFHVQSLTDLPGPPGGLTDKHEHFFFYGVLAALALRALARGEWRRVTLGVAFGAALISSLYGVTDEIHQRFVPGREYEILDMAANAIGSAAAAGMLWAWGILKRRSEAADVL